MKDNGDLSGGIAVGVEIVVAFCARSHAGSSELLPLRVRFAVLQGDDDD